MPWFEARNLRKVYPLGDGESVALDDFSLDAERGDFVGIVGRSGSGKTTFLRIVAGLLRRSGGELRLDGREIAKEADGTEEKIGIVFQEPRLMPWLTIEKNILFAFLKYPRREQPIQMAGELLAMLGLSAYKDAYPSQLSGGMAQRVALGRVLCYGPELILMDEPLGALDYFTRKSLQDEILKLYASEGKTILFVTHDVEEALILSRRVIVLEQGRLLREIPVEIDYPRKRTDPRFAALLEEILSLISKEGVGAGM